MLGVGENLSFMDMVKFCLLFGVSFSFFICGMGIMIFERL